MIYKNINIDDSIFYNVSEDMAKEYIDARILKKKPLTQGAFKRAIKAASGCTGCTPDEALQITIDKGWNGVTPEYITAELNRRMQALHQSLTVNSPQRINDFSGKPVRDTRVRTIEEDLSDRSWAK